MDNIKCTKTIDNIKQWLAVAIIFPLILFLYPALAQPQNNGMPLDLNWYCGYQTGNPNATATYGDWNDPYSWRCISGNTSSKIDLDDACKCQYGGNYAAKLVTPNAYGWACFNN